MLFRSHDGVGRAFVVAPLIAAHGEGTGGNADHVLGCRIDRRHDAGEEANGWNESHGSIMRALARGWGPVPDTRLKFGVRPFEGTANGAVR